MSAVDPGSATLRLPDGRSLGYCEFGDPGGVPVLFFHGLPGSRLSGGLLAEHAAARGVRLIALDRPGFGLSSFQPERTRRDWPADVRTVGDLLGLERFAVLGWSAGGPYALACAALIPDRVSATGVLAGVGGLGGFDLRALRGLLSLRLTGDLDDFPERIARAWTRTRSETAQEAASIIAAGIREGLRESPLGALHELRLLGRAWDIDPAAIDTVPVRFWHGSADMIVPARQTRRLAPRVPGALATYFPQLGHVSLLTIRGAEVLSEITGIH